MSYATKINQTKLIHDVVSHQVGFDVFSPAGIELDHYGDHSVLEYEWFLFDKLDGTEEMAAAWHDHLWLGVKAG